MIDIDDGNDECISRSLTCDNVKTLKPQETIDLIQAFGFKPDSGYIVSEILVAINGKSLFYENLEQFESVFFIDTENGVQLFDSLNKIIMPEEM